LGWMNELVSLMSYDGGDGCHLVGS
jgi:hypothetical protein